MSQRHLSENERTSALGAQISTRSTGKGPVISKLSLDTHVAVYSATSVKRKIHFCVYYGNRLVILPRHPRENERMSALGARILTRSTVKGPAMSKDSCLLYTSDAADE